MKIIIKTALLLFCSIPSASAQKLPAKNIKKVTVPPARIMTAEETTLAKLIAIAKDPKDNGLSLIDTVMETLAYDYVSTLQYPGAISTEIKYRSVTYSGNTAHVKYTWNTVIAKAVNGDSNVFANERNRQRDFIKSILPGIKDSFSIYKGSYTNANSYIWMVNPGLRIDLVEWTDVDNPRKKELSISAYVEKNVEQDKTKVAGAIYDRYYGRLASAPTRALAETYFNTLWHATKDEGLSSAELTEKLGPTYRSLADKDMRAAFSILLSMPQSDMQVLRSMLNDDQKAQVSKMAQKVVDDYNAKWYPNTSTPGSGTVSTASAFDPCAHNKQVYPTGAYVDQINGKGYYVQSYNCNSDLYTVLSREFISVKKSNWVDNGARDHYEQHLEFYDGKNLSKLFAGKSYKSATLCSACGGYGVVTENKAYKHTAYGVYTDWETTGTIRSTEACKVCFGLGIKMN